MNVQELIDKLEECKDKSRPVMLASSNAVYEVDGVNDDILFSETNQTIYSDGESDLDVADGVPVVVIWLGIKYF